MSEFEHSTQIYFSTFLNNYFVENEPVPPGQNSIKLASDSSLDNQNRKLSPWRSSNMGANESKFVKTLSITSVEMTSVKTGLLNVSYRQIMFGGNKILKESFEHCIFLQNNPSLKLDRNGHYSHHIV